MAGYDSRLGHVRIVRVFLCEILPRTSFASFWRNISFLSCLILYCYHIFSFYCGINIICITFTQFSFHFTNNYVRYKNPKLSVRGDMRPVIESTNSCSSTSIENNRNRGENTIGMET